MTTHAELLRDHENVLREVGAVPRRDALDSVDLLDDQWNDYGNALRLLRVYGEEILFCTPMRRWLIFDGVRYVIDEKDAIRKLAQDVMVEFARQAVASGNNQLSNFAGRCLNTRRISDCIREAQPLRPVSPQELDTNPYLLNCLNGTLDLRTGALLPHSREDRITKLVSLNYHPDQKCPTFDHFMDRTLGPLVRFMQKALGYSLTGVTSEKVAFLLHGPTNTGKTTLLELFRSLLPEYSTLMIADNLMARHNNRDDNNASSDLADLRGVRFCMTSETEEGQRLRESRLKRITQGQGLIKAARKYENCIQFPETHKLWIDSNHRPVIGGTDDSIWRRLVPIPFERPLPDSEIDAQLPQKLRQEDEGILAWLIEGARLWYEEGLGRIAEVESARDEWREDSNRFDEFIKTRCVEQSNLSTGATRLLTEYNSWADEVGEPRMSRNEFGERLVQAGFKRARDSKGLVIYRGIGLNKAAI